MKNIIMMLFGLFMAAQSALALNKADLVGTWKLVSLETQFQDGRQSLAQFGANPLGFLIYTNDNRVMVIGESAGRKVPKNDEERAALYVSMFAYTGIYRIDGDTVTLKVDVTAQPALRGVDMMRTYKLSGDRLEITPAWAPSPNLPGNPVVRAISNWSRMK